MTIRCGTCAFADHTFFYPRSVRPENRLAYYAKYFSVVEIDSSFYRIPSVHSAKRWLLETPDSFKFHVKAHRTFTRHDRGATDGTTLLNQLAEFLEVADCLASSGKLGIILLQFPPWFGHTQQNCAYVEWLVEKLTRYEVGVEFRHRSWWLDDVRSDTSAWLAGLKAVNVVCDEPQIGMGTIPFIPDVTNKSLVVMRLHGRNAETWYQRGHTSSQQRFDYRYEKEELKQLLPSVQRWAHEAREVHILMNNNQANYAIVNAFDWLDLLEQQPVQRPDLRISEQMRLFD